MMKRAACVLMAFLANSANAFTAPSPLLSSSQAGRSRRTELYHHAEGDISPRNVLLIGGTRFSGLYVWQELVKRGHKVTLFNRGKTALKQIPGETDEEFEHRKSSTTFVTGDRQDPESLAQLKDMDFNVVYDMNGRERSDTQPLADMFKGKLEHFVYMSSAGVYLKSDSMPHREGDATDPKCRHKGKLDTEQYLVESGVPFTSFRPTYICGPLNYNPVEEMFFERIDAGRPVCVPGHGEHLTGLGHVKDLAVAFVNVIGKDHVKGRYYNMQCPKAVSFDGAVRLAAEAAGKDPKSVEIVHYNPKDYDFGKKKAFPFRPQHFFASVEDAQRDLNWTPKYTNKDIFEDFYKNDFLAKKAAGGLKGDFGADDMVLAKLK
uniref:NAD-dependent epimerase/dehydratase domain-containing protein n=1 Tax=Chromera velia CCMP2878 TaxID=1169474 RepID=A0A0G4HZ55_9ALVE|eukprot:Cvel_1564.t1-p1 / transcript=Cvel_1564.t1 / gene=Cvel_1564 / organism=Chromera_velia_CCMP2878 / gene_product=Chloroplast stem-loop binding protein of 41 kDa b,, putative / transcript_product=Chloroplast stem-loop binding protein of 41 kDa b,, putative / location=Cvel_scaffold55:143514-146470(-) / protein_length=375 / sequence_SO=supercontig / SO=protein_coding / is_pseudo=false